MDAGPSLSKQRWTVNTSSAAAKRLETTTVAFKKSSRSFEPSRPHNPFTCSFRPPLSPCVLPASASPPILQPPPPPTKLQPPLCPPVQFLRPALISRQSPSLLLSSLNPGSTLLLASRRRLPERYYACPWHHL